MSDALGRESVFDRIDPERLWISTILTVIAVLVGGSLLFPQQVYGSFIWRYFWGPVVADGTGSQCAHYRDGETVLIESAADCQTATGIVAEPGYTTVSTVSYAIVLLFAIIGVIFLLRRLNIGQTRGFFFALVPFMLFYLTDLTVVHENVDETEGWVRIEALPSLWTQLPDEAVSEPEA